MDATILSTILGPDSLVKSKTPQLNPARAKKNQEIKSSQKRPPPMPFPTQCYAPKNAQKKTTTRCELELASKKQNWQKMPTENIPIQKYAFNNEVDSFLRYGYGTED